MKQFLLAVIGAILGAFIPVASFTLARYECAHYPWLWILVAGGFLFSSFTVFGWAKRAFGHAAKALGFVILTEGVLVLCHTSWLSIGGLIILAGLNGIATSSNMFRDATDSDTTPAGNNLTTLGLSYDATPAVTPKRKPASRVTERAKAAARAKRYRDRKRDANTNVTQIRA